MSIAPQVTLEAGVIALAAYGSEPAFKERALGDHCCAAPALLIARAHARSGAAPDVYRFGFVSPSMCARLKGAPHASDRQYVFGNLGASPWPTGAQDKAVADVVGSLWARFATTARPGERVLDIDGPMPTAKSLKEMAPLMLSVPGAYRESTN